jgi:hypothetical protein
MKPIILLPLLATLLVACSGLSLSPMGTQAPGETVIPTASYPSAFTATPQSSHTPLASSTPVPSDTPVPSSTPEPSQTPLPSTATTGSSNPYGDLNNIQQYFNPTGMPVKSWHGIPVMSEAISGQEFNSDIYSYRAATSLSKAVNFYTTQLQALGLSYYGPGSGYSGTGSNAQHNGSFFLSGFLIYIDSYDNDTGHVIVVIKSR